MLPTTGRILPLPVQVASQIQSSTSINSIDCVIIGLIKNSLDANAHRIVADVDFRRGVCTVEDDGYGIPPIEFSEDGGLGKVHHTSKNDIVNLFHGGDGTFISSLAALSILTITSHHYAHRSHATLILHHSRPAARLFPAPVRHHLSNREHGTRVTVQDLFGNIPVRVKQRAAIHDGRKHERRWDILCKSVVGVLLPWGAPISFTLKNAESSKRLTIRAKDDVSTSNAADGYSFKPFSIALTRSILSQAGYIQPSDWHEWIKTSICTSAVIIHGAISLKPAPSRNIQFISLGIRPLNMETNNFLFDEINQIFALSDFGKLEDISDLGSLQRKDNRTKSSNKQTEYTKKQLKGGGKGIDKWPMFCICINFKNCPKWPQGRSTEYLESDNTLSSIISALEAMITGFLSDHHFRPRVKRSRICRAVSNGSTFSKDSSSTVSPYVENKAEGRFSGLNDQVPRDKASLVDQKYQSPDNGLSPRISADLLSSNIRFPIFRRRDSHEEIGIRTRSRIKGDLCESPRGLLSQDDYDLKKKLAKGQAKSDSQNTSTQVVKYFKESKKVAANVSTPKKENFCAVDERSEKLCALSETNDEEDPVSSSISAVQSDNEGNTESTEETVKWVNPVSGDTIHVSLRTGLAIRQPSKHSLEITEPETLILCTTKPIAKTSKLTQLKPKIPAVPRSESWVGQLLKNWENPIFGLTEEAISRVSFGSPSVQSNRILQGRLHWCSDLETEKSSSESSFLFSTKISKEALRKAKVLAQVDRKFILIVVSIDSEANSRRKCCVNTQEILVLIDQHAADERIRVETLHADLCKTAISSSGTGTNLLALCQSSAIKTCLLAKPIMFLVQQQEHDLFKSQASYFAKWGICYELSISQVEPNPTKLKESRVIIKSLPEVIAERCRADPKTLIDMMREEVWKRQGLGSKSSPHPVSPFFATEGTMKDCIYPPTPIPTRHHEWLQRIGDCPRGIIDMMNSRACRSAIMFNDPLTLAECQTLVRKLSACAFPFQCAHGRPSMTPLVQLGGSGSDGLSCREEVSVGKLPWLNGGNREKDFGRAWREWREGLKRGKEDCGDDRIDEQI